MSTTTILLAAFLAVSVTPFVLWKLAQTYFHARFSGIPDVKNLGKAPKNGKVKGQVVICGGSIAGLLTARICADHFEKVLIVEPEAWLDTEDGKVVRSWEQKNTRSRVMQYHATHGVQGLNWMILCKLFPGFEDECKKSGITVGLANNIGLGGTSVKMPSDDKYVDIRKTAFMSRAGQETLIRRLLLSGSYGNIKQVCGTITGLIPDPTNHSKLAGVTMRTPRGNENLEASLVVDCTGLTKAGFKWLERAGYGYSDVYPKGRLPFDKIRIEIDQKLFYATQTYTLSDSLFKRLPVPGGMADARTVFMYLEDQPVDRRRMFVISKPDGQRIQLYVGESSDSHPSLKTLDEVIAFKDCLPPFRDPFPEWLHQTVEMLREAEDTMVLSSGRVPATSYLRYHMATNLPSNFVAIGDSVMSIDPVYGQGCTKAGLGAISLNNMLRTLKTPEISSDFSERYFKEHCDKTEVLWEGTRLLDYGLPCTVPLPGEDLSMGARVRAYIRRVQILAIDDEQAAMTLVRTIMGFASPFDSFHPWLAAKVAWDVLKRGNNVSHRVKVE